MASGSGGGGRSGGRSSVSAQRNAFGSSRSSAPF